MREKLPIFLTGGFGGIFPNLIDLASTLTGDNPSLPEPTYFIGIFIFFLIGAAVTLIWGEKDLKKVFYLGLGLPSFIQLNAASLSANQNPTPTLDTSRAPFIMLATPAYAQTPDSVSTPSVKRTLKIDAPQDASSISVAFFSEKQRKVEIVEVNLKKDREIKVPEFAEDFRVQIRSSSSEPMKLPAKAEPLTISLDVKKRAWSGLLRSLGFRNVEEFDITITKVDTATNRENRSDEE